MYEAKTIANWLLAWAEEEFQESISKSQMQKLLYYAQAHYIAERGEPLFYDNFQAWAYGPVIPELYFEADTYDDVEHILVPPTEDEFGWDEVSEEDADFLVKFWNTYREVTPKTLFEMSHYEEPWVEAFASGRNTVIATESLKHSYRKAA